MTRERVLVARVSRAIDAPRERVWAVVADPMRYLPATEFQAEWREGGSMHWTSDLEGRHLVVDGTILRLEAPRLLEYRYTNPLSKTAHVVTIELSSEDAGTRIAVSEDGHATARELAHGEGAWRLMLSNIAAQLERGISAA